jgi:hypothetical protein
MKCQIDELGLGYSKCDNEDIKVTVQERNKKDEPINYEICTNCWIKLSKNDKFYTKDKLS